MNAPYNAVLIQPDGTRRDVPVDRGRYLEALRALVGGDIEFTYYGTRKSAVCLVVHETGPIDGMPVNVTATQFAEAMRGGPLPYFLHGPVVALDYQQVPDEMGDLSAFQRVLLDEIAGEERAA